MGSRPRREPALERHQPADPVQPGDSNGPGLDNSNIADINVPVWVATVHAHPGIKAIIAIGGKGNDNWGPACNNANRAQFVQNLVGFATSNGFDGIDLDIEDGPWMREARRTPR